MNDVDEFQEEGQMRRGAGGGVDSKRQGHPQINTRSVPSSNAVAPRREAKQATLPSSYLNKKPGASGARGEEAKLPDRGLRSNAPPQQ